MKVGRCETLLLPVVLFTFLVLPSRPARAEAASSDIERLQSEIDRLQAQIQSLRDQVSQRKAAEGTVSEKAKEVAVRALDGISLYGFLKGDGVYKDSEVDNPDAPRFLKAENVEAGRDETTFTAQHTRLGANWSGPAIVGGGVANGKVEIDFFDSGSNHSMNPRIRLGYVELAYPDWTIRMGQDWDVFSPLGPTTFNTNGYLWQGGNVGYRRAQLRVENRRPLGEAATLITRASVNQNDQAGDSGRDSIVPIFEGRIGLASGGSALGVSGAWGDERQRQVVDSTTKDFSESLWGIGFDLTAALTAELSLQGEFVYGENLDTFLGGIAQGVNGATEEGIATRAGWGQLIYRPCQRLRLAAGGGIDDPESGDLGAGGRDRNLVAFGSATYFFSDRIQAGLEYFYFETLYKDLEGRDLANANIVWTSLVYVF